MYTSIAVALDNSTWSGYAENIALQIALPGKIPVTGVHAYTGTFHQTRFRALERHLPARYQGEEALTHQREIHSVLIGRGLELISLEYMRRLGDACREREIPFTEKIVDGKNADVVISVTGRQGLTVTGAEGLGRTEGVTGLGSTTRRTLRWGSGDLLIAKKEGRLNSILAGVDGSQDAFRMVGKAADLARSLGISLTIAAAYDPGLHRTVFGSLAGTLSKEAGTTFRFADQEKLHNDIIDKSLADLYSRYLEHAAAIAGEHGVPAATRLVQGKPFHALCNLAEELSSDLVVVGHSGMHRSRYSDIGSTTERVAELAKTNVLVVRDRPEEAAGKKEKEVPQPAGDAGTSSASPAVFFWEDEARKRLENVPAFARPMAIMAIERYAKEQRITTITPEVMRAAREKIGG
jgi:nucleotide-binding universal stress UspA family protein